MKLVGLGGSLRRYSFSLAVLTEALDIAATQNVQTELLDLRTLNLPIFLPEVSLEMYTSEDQVNIARFLHACRTADAMIWSSPTYHGTVSGIMKNAIDFIELMRNDDPPYLTGRAIGLLTINDSAPWTAMRDSVHELRAWISPTSIMVTKDDFTSEMVLADERVRNRVKRMVGELLNFKLHEPLKMKSQRISQ
jgi:FMN reductase